MEAPLCLTYHFSKKKPRRNIPPDYSLLPIDRGGGVKQFARERETERERFEAFANSARKTSTAGKSFDAEKFTGSALLLPPPPSLLFRLNRLSVNLTRAHRWRFANSPRRHIWPRTAYVAISYRYPISPSPLPSSSIAAFLGRFEVEEVAAAPGKMLPPAITGNVLPLLLG